MLSRIICDLGNYTNKKLLNGKYGNRMPVNIGLWTFCVSVCFYPVKPRFFVEMITGI